MQWMKREGRIYGSHEQNYFNLGHEVGGASPCRRWDLNCQRSLHLYNPPNGYRCLARRRPKRGQL